MQHSPSEIKEKLLRSLDKEYNVINYGAVEEVIGILEKMPMSKEVLETTRLGRYINELRKKTTDDMLAKRAKGLVRQWRHMIMPDRQSPAHKVNGACASAGASPVQSTHTPGHEASPSPHSPAASPERPPHHADSVPRTNAANKRLRKDELDDDQPQAKVARQVNGGLDSDNSVESAPVIVEVSTTTGRRRRAHRTANSNMDDIVKEKLASAARALRVKTTQELLAGLSSCSSSGSYTPPNTTPDSVPVSPVVRSPQASVNTLRSVSNELVPNSPCLSPAPPVPTPSPTPPLVGEEVTVVSTPPVTPVNTRLPSSKRGRPPRNDGGSTVNSQPARPPPTAPSPTPSPSLSPDRSVSSLPTTVASDSNASCDVEAQIADLLSRLPPIDASAVSWEEPSLPSPRDYQPADLLSDQIDGVTGNLSHDGEFREWHECLSRTIMAEELLHILPYTIID